MYDRLWSAIGGSPETQPDVALGGPDVVLPSRFDVTRLAAGSVAVATAAAAHLLAVRTGSPIRQVSVDRRSAGAAFVSQALLRPAGWTLPPTWDPIAGDYVAADGWIRLHTNYAHHRAAVAAVLGSVPDRRAAAVAVARWSARDLETAVVSAGGAAAAMHTRASWRASEPGGATLDEPLLRLDIKPAETSRRSLPPMRDARARPFDGVRVLDLTRVIAGPVGTRFLAAYGADVLRIDPRGFDEVPSLVPETTVGKRCAALDLRAPADRAVFERLVRTADVLVAGLRPDALSRLGYGPDELRSLNPALTTASLCAYGWAGPWSGRRGFDSLVQMSSGIAAGDGDIPDPLPAQALDHGTGYLLAGAVGVALARRATDGAVTDIRGSLIATANLLLDHPTPDAVGAPDPGWSDTDTVDSWTFWGPARRVPTPARIDGVEARWDIAAGPLGRDQADW